MKIHTIIAAITAFVMPTSLIAKDGDPDIQPKQRLVAAKKILKNQKNKVSVYVKGLVCSSCSIGVKIHLRKLDGVDKSQKNKGVTLDINSQLATISLKDGATLKQSDILAAIKKSGYEAETVFKWNGSKISAKSLTF